MKNLKMLLQPVDNKVELPKNGIAGKILKSILVVFVLSWISLLSSCVVAVPNQRYQRHTIAVEQDYRGERHDNGRHRGWYKHDGHQKYRDNDDRRDRDHHHDRYNGND